MTFLRTIPVATLNRGVFAIVLGIFFAAISIPASLLSAAESQTITLKDWTGRGFSPDLVNYSIPAPADGGKSLRILDEHGKAIPIQLSPAANGQATLSFVASIAPDGTSSYTLENHGLAPVPTPGVCVTQDAETWILSNQTIGVKVPGPVERSFDKPVSADSLPAPIIAFRGPDGSWRGEGSVLSKRAVSKMTIKQIASGPVYVETAYRLDYAQGGYYEARVRVTDQAPFAQVTEEYDLGVAANQNYWQLDLSKGWKPDSAEHMFVAGQGFGPIQYPTLADEEKTVGSGPNVGPDVGGGPAPTRCIHHDSCWGTRFVSYYGVHNAAARLSSPESYPLAMVAPLHKGLWRRANSLPVYVKSGDVQVRFPMDVAPISWLNEPASDVSPFSCQEHDPSLPATYGRRVWALVLAKPTLLVKGYGDPKTMGIGYAVRLLYGSVGLDRYKDFVLSWPDAHVTYPRVFATPQLVAKYREAVAADPHFPLLSMVSANYWFTNDPATAQKELPLVHQRLTENVAYIASSISIHHHQTLAAYGEPIGHAESVLSWSGLPQADRELIRARLALLCYLLTDPDVTSAGDGSHHGNPNMGISRLMDRSNLMALIPDHPMFKTWRDYMGMFMAYKMGEFMAPGGGWFEYGASYHMHGYGKILRGMMGIYSSQAPQADQIWNYHRADFEYYMNLLSPVDPRYGSRTIPGTANAPVGNPPHFIQAMATVSDRDPSFAANLRWAWDASGQMIGTGGDAITLPAMARPQIPASEPKLTSRIFPGYGVIFRANQGPDETALYLRSGYLWSHWNQDQGNLILYSKGAVLIPPQPYQYGGPGDKTFPDKNFIRFGDPTNDLPHDWANSNVIDSHFSNSVDYAWSSTGYPDWFIHPGGKTGFSKPRELVSGLDQKEGDFTWDRQIAFMKGATGKSPNYFVVRDSMNGEGKLASWFNLSLLGRKSNVSIDGQKVSVDTEWPTKMDLFFPGREKLAFDMFEDKLTLFVIAYNKFTGNFTPGQIFSRDWIGRDGKPVAFAKELFKAFQGATEQHLALRLQSAPGQEINWIIYPRGQGEASPTVAQLAPGVTKVVTSEGTDYVFLSTHPLKFNAEDVVFEGLAGAVRIGKDGRVTVVLSAGPGRVGYKGAVVESDAPFERPLGPLDKSTVLKDQVSSIQMPQAPTDAKEFQRGVVKEVFDRLTRYTVDAPSVVSSADGSVRLQARKATIEIGANQVRFVVPERSYVQLTVGNVGVRGVGPFDLTFTPSDISGKVDGDTRTLVTTWPSKITRPAYAMDGVRWYAGFADEHAIYKDTPGPEFGIALGVTSGAHTVKISEWEWPAMPSVPERVGIPIK